MVERAKPRRTWIAWPPVLVYCALIVGCQARSVAITTLRGQAMGTTYSIKYVPTSTAQSVGQKIDAELARFGKVFSTYDPDSEISRFNRHASTAPFAASPEFRAVVGRAVDLARRTQGAFDPTVGPVLRLWGFGPGAKTPATPPTDQALAAVLAHSGWRKLTVGAEQLTKSVPGLELDLNASAKGAGVDRVAALLERMGITSYMVEIGGEVRCRGEKPNGKPWRLGVAQPGGGPGQYAAEVDLIDRAMATSGNYIQVHRVGKQRAHHIVDPRTGKNAPSNVVSVTVLAKTCELADGLATGLMVLGPDAGKAVLDGLDVKVLFLLVEDGKVTRREIGW